MRSLAIDILKIILAAFVVFLHMNILRDSYSSLSYILVDGLFRVAVPVFLIITGYYFYYIDNTAKLKKWLIRIFLLYSIWSVVYIPYWDKGYAFFNLLFGYHHLWYLIGTFFAGIILFSLRKKSTKTLLLLIIPLFCCGYLIQLLGGLHYFKGKTDLLINQYPYYRNFLFVCFPFMGIGFLIRKLNLEAKYKPSLVQVLLALGLVIFEAFLNYKIIGLDKKESIDLLLSLLIACPLLFLYCKNISATTNSNLLASVSTAIYLVHPLLMKLIFSFPPKPFEYVIFTIALLMASLLLVLINKKVKYLL